VIYDTGMCVTDKMLYPLTHVPKTGAINWLRFSGANFWYVCHAYLAPDSSGTR